MRALFTVLLVAPLLSSCFISIGGGGDSWERFADEASSSPGRAQELRRENRQNLGKLEVGMTREDVDRVMGRDARWVSREIGWVDSPYKISRYRSADERDVTVLYYYTDIRKRDDIIDDDELTPVVLIDGTVVGWGHGYQLPRPEIADTGLDPRPRAQASSS